MESVEGNHRNLAECVEALKREVETLRRELAVQQRAKEATGRERQDEEERLPWKFRND